MNVTLELIHWHIRSVLAISATSTAAGARISVIVRVWVGHNKQLYEHVVQRPENRSMQRVMFEVATAQSGSSGRRAAASMLVISTHAGRLLLRGFTGYSNSHWDHYDRGARKVCGKRW